MDTLEFIAAVVRAVAWPVAVVVLVLLLRESLTKVLSRPGLRQLKAGPSGVEAVWEETLTEAKVELESLTAGGIETQLQEPAREARLADLGAVVEDQPRAAIMEAFARVEAALRERLQRVAGEAPPKEGARGLVRRAAEAEAISEETVHALDGLIVLRNLAAHGGGRGHSRARGPVPRARRLDPVRADAGALVVRHARQRGGRRDRHLEPRRRRR